MTQDQTRFRLTIPVGDAFAFAMGWSDLGYESPSATMRQVMGLLVVDGLEYSEQWRVAAQARVCLAERWPGCFCFKLFIPALASRTRDSIAREKTETIAPDAPALARLSRFAALVQPNDAGKQVVSS